MHILIMPRQGNTVESCIIGAWRVKEGDSITAETVVCDVETDKAAFEIPAGAAGTVLKILYGAGDDVPVLKPIAVIGAPGEDYSAALAAEGGAEALGGGQASVKPDAAAETPTQVAASRPASAEEQSITKGVSPRARNLAADEGLTLEGLSGSGPGGRVIERDVRAALASRLSGGSGLGGRLSSEDAAEAAVRKPAASQKTDEGSVTESEIKGIRKVISDRMIKSLAETAQFTLNSYASAVRLQELRARFKAVGETEGLLSSLSKITVNDLVLYAVSRTLPAFPFMNAHKNGSVLRVFERVHLGMAVDTPRGLLVPVICNANLLSLREISAEAKRLAKAAQDGTAKPEELSGSTFTVTNLGSLGVTSFTPVLNIPEVAILGVAGIEPRPVQKDCASGECGAYAFEPHIGFSLTINHQVVDGAPAARFLKALGEAVSGIDLLLAL